MNVVVTGSTSFLGAALIRELLGLGCRVYAVVRPGSRNLTVPVIFFSTLDGTGPEAITG